MTAFAARLLRAAIRDCLALVGWRLDRHARRWVEDTADEEEGG